MCIILYCCNNSRYIFLHRLRVYIWISRTRAETQSWYTHNCKISAISQRTARTERGGELDSRVTADAVSRRRKKKAKHALLCAAVRGLFYIREREKVRLYIYSYTAREAAAPARSSAIISEELRFFISLHLLLLLLSLTLPQQCCSHARTGIETHTHTYIQGIKAELSCITKGGRVHRVEKI